ncbi:MAG: four-carbon acid sugar kinase family protein [Lentilitoribacter sp.]
MRNCNLNIAVIADDLTSAADGGSPFWSKGYQVSVWRGESFLSPPLTDVVSIDCASRSLDEHAAAQATSCAVNSVRGASVLYKTIDSTLRGHIRAEIGAAYHASKRNRLVIAPAFPDAGRTTRNGVQYVHGETVCKSNFAKDPVHPVISSKVIDYIPSDIHNVVILNAETQQELNEQVATLGEFSTTLWVGSPGMAIALAHQMPFVPRATNQLLKTKSVLVVVGSANPISRLQASKLCFEHRALCLTPPDARSLHPKKVLDELINSAARSIDQFQAIIATGGDTMEAILNRLDILRFMLTGEIEPGFPIGTANLADGRPITLAIKAGGFGDENTLLRAVQYLCTMTDVQSGNVK